MCKNLEKKHEKGSLIYVGNFIKNPKILTKSMYGGGPEQRSSGAYEVLIHE
jgi:hypothetical protein